MQNLVLLQIFSCFFLTGLIWTIQLVHYPTFFWVAKEGFANFADFHSFRISLIVVPIMILELVTAALLLFSTNELSYNKTYLVLNLVGVLAIWASTFLLSVPCHNILIKGYEESAIVQLV